MTVETEKKLIHYLGTPPQICWPIVPYSMDIRNVTCERCRNWYAVHISDRYA